MKKNIFFVVLFLGMVSLAITLAGCGQQATSSSGNTSLDDAVASDPGLYDFGGSDSTFGTSSVGSPFSIMYVSSEETRDYSWYRTFNTPSSITITDITVEATSAEVVVTRTVTGVLNAKMTSSSGSTSESFSQDFTRYVTLTNTNGSWKISKVTQGISHSVADSTSPFNSITSDITIDSVSIYDVTSGITFEVTQEVSSAGPWIDYSNIATTEGGHTLQVTVLAEQIGNVFGPVPYVFIWPDLSGTGNFFRHQLAYSAGHSPFTYSYSFTVPANESTTRKKMTIGAFSSDTLASNEAEGAYDFTSWHIPYRVE